MRFLKSAVLIALIMGIIPQAKAANFTTNSNLNEYTDDDVGNLTLTGRDQFDTQLANTPSITIKGSTSGSTILKATATAGSGTLTLPTSTDTISVNGTLAPTGTISPSGVTFSTAETGNPLMLMTVQNIPVASVNAGYNMLVSVSGKKIFPGIPTVMVSGTAAGATSVYIVCSSYTSGTNAVLASFPIAALVTAIPVTPFSSTGTNSPIRGAAFASGCPASDSLLISAQGSALTTTTNVYVNLPYTIQ